MRGLVSGIAFLVCALAAANARADEAEEGEAKIAAPQVDLEKDKKPATADPNAPPPEAPPPLPYKKTLVLDSSIGALTFLGQFGKVAPTAPWLHMQLGYELFKWLMVFGEGELAFTDTSIAQPPPRTRAFPMYGFGAGARFTIRFTDRVGVYAQGDLGLMKADVAQGGLGILGFKDAESLGPWIGARLGVEWYQIDRHFGLGLTTGIRDAQNFGRLGIGGDSPLMLDVGASLRYAF